MKQNFDEFSMREAQRLAQTDIGRQLAALFQQTQGSAISDPAKMDMEQLKKAISAFAQDPKAKALLKKLQEEQK